jgi:hypothetical protein
MSTSKRELRGEEAVATIACLGWGSLIWDPRELPIHSEWFKDGPMLRVEFLRHSGGDRITLVLHERAPPVRSLWASMTCEDVRTAKVALSSREGCNTKHIASWTRGEPNPSNLIDFPAWAASREIEAAVWTALPPKFGSDRRVPSIEEVIEHLRALTGARRNAAEAYVRRAPKQIDTPYRRRIEAELGWAYQDRSA